MTKAKVLNKRRKSLERWEIAVENMSAFEIPEDYNIKTNDKYDRFTGYLKEWVFRTLTATSDGNTTYKLTQDIDDDINDLFFARFIFDVSEDKKNEWWKHAIDVGRGKKGIENKLTKINKPGNNDREAVFGMFMPAYRAIKEKFDRRSAFQWIFNHGQYVAERDSLRALKGIIGSLAGVNEQQIEVRLAEDKKNIPTSNKELFE